MRADNSHHIVAAARRRAQATHAKALRAVRDMDATGEPVTFDKVAEKAGVSRSWLYSHDDVREQIERIRATQRRAPATLVPTGQRASDASLLRRLEVAVARTRQLTEENQRLREQLACALGEQRARAVCDG